MSGLFGRSIRLLRTMGAGESCTIRELIVLKEFELIFFHVVASAGRLYFQAGVSFRFPRCEEGWGVVLNKG